jgi:phage I-like protein
MKTILNRTFQLPADDWYEIEVQGEHYNADSKVVQIIDGRAIDAIVNRFKEESATPDFAGILIDRDHFSLDTDKPSKAAGWVMGLRNRDGRLEAQIRWSKSGREEVEGGDYRFFSTVYPTPSECEDAGTRTVKNRNVRAIRPLRLDRLAITNDPNNKGQKPISNRQPATPAARSENQPTTIIMKTLLKKLGLADDASEDSAVTALDKIINRATTAESERDTIKGERDELLGAQVEADLDKHAAVIVNRDEVKKQLIANRKGTLALLESIKPADGKKTEAAAPITNRQTAKTPATDAGADDAEKAKAAKARGAKIANRAAELRATNPRLSRSQAFKKAEAEIGE